MNNKTVVEFASLVGVVVVVVVVGCCLPCVRASLWPRSTNEPHAPIVQATVGATTVG